MPEYPAFGEEIDKYTVVRLALANYRGTDRLPPLEAEFPSPDIRAKIRKDEKRLLQSYFRHWEMPYNGRLRGWRDDSPIYLLWNGQLACGAYLCGENEFDNAGKWGQLHYPFVDPEHKGRGLFSLVFREAVRRAQSWGLTGFYISSNRYMHAEVYERWGAVHYKEIPKSFVYPKHRNMGSHNWLVHKIHDQMLAKLLRRYASGVLVDIGCGEKPYVCMTKGLVEQHIGVDHVETLHGRENIDVLASAYDTTLQDASADTILCTAVLEHLEQPEDALGEMRRILKPGGYVILSAPLFWHLHEAPRDFYRFTEYGLRYLFHRAGFETVEVVPLSGFVVTFAQELCYFLQGFRRWYSDWLIRSMQTVLQRLAHRLWQRDRSHGFTWMYLAVARKPL